MNRLRSASVLVLALGMSGALTACGEESTDAAADPSPTTSTSSAPSPTQTTEGAAATSTAPESPATAPVLGPDGLGALMLGMDRDQAEATGVVEPFVNEPNSETCTWRSRLSGAPAGEATVFWSETLGVVTIDVSEGVHTPEGIGIGSPVTAVDQAYPDWNPSDNLLRGAAPVPGNDEAVYRIAFDRTGTVTEVTLQHTEAGCYE